MAKFLTGKELTSKVYDIIWKAESNLVIVSPYIKLDDYFKRMFLNHRNNHKLHILIIFGKNESKPAKSLKHEDFDFFKQFRNISVVYCKDLHAKYYANDSEGVVTSINLYDTNFETNLEYGVSYTRDFLDNFKQSFDTEAYAHTMELALSSPAIYVKRPVYDKILLGLHKSYVDSEVLLDQTDVFLRGRGWGMEQKHMLSEYPEEMLTTAKPVERPERTTTLEEPRKMYTHSFVSDDDPYGFKQKKENGKAGYCIRTGKEIPFNPAKPLSAEAYQSWARFSNPDYEESYCHKTGRKSYGKTSVRNPIL